MIPRRNLGKTVHHNYRSGLLENLSGVEAIRKLRKDLIYFRDTSKKTKLSQDWFWHPDSLAALEKLEHAIESDEKALNDYTASSNLKYFSFKLSSLISRLKLALKESKEKHPDVESLKKNEQEINAILSQMNETFTSLLDDFGVLDQHYADDPDLEHKKILVKLGLNIFSYPLVTQMLLDDWSLVEELKDILSSDPNITFHYLWKTMRLFKDFFFVGFQESEIKAIRKKYVGNKTPEQIYKDPHFLSDFKGFLHEVSQRKRTMAGVGQRNLRAILLSLAMIIRVETLTKSYPDENICDRAIPTIRSFIKDSKDAQLLYNSLASLYRASKYPYYPTKVAELFHYLNSIVIKIGFQNFLRDLTKLCLTASRKKIEITSYFRSIRNAFDNGASWNEVIESAEYLIQQNPSNFNHIDDALFRVSAQAWKELSPLEVITSIEQLLKSSGKYFQEVLIGFNYGLEFLGHGVTWKNLIQDLPKMAKVAKGESRAMFRYGLSGINKYLFVGLTWAQVVNVLPKLAREGGEAAMLFLSNDAGILGKIGGKKITWQQLFADLPKLSKLGSQSVLLLKFLIDEVKTYNWSAIVEFIQYIAESKQRTRQFVNIMSGIDPPVRAFMMYLIQFRKKQVLDIIGKYRMLENLEVNYNHELNLFFKVASPLTSLEGDFLAIKKVLIPLNALPDTDRRKFSRLLNKSVETFQGITTNFLKSLQATEGFEDSTQYSFTTLVYIYLKFASNPDIKRKNLFKAIQKLQKEQRKLLRAIESKSVLIDLNKTQRAQFRATLKSISGKFFEPLLALYSENIHDRLEARMQELFLVSNIKNIESKATDPDFHNAILLLNVVKNRKIKLYQICFNLIQHYLRDETYPLTRNIWNTYPWNLPENQAWAKVHLRNKLWVKGFKKIYHSGQLGESNIKERIQHHLNDAKGILQKLGVDLVPLNLKNIEAQYELLSKKHKDGKAGVLALLSDLKTQIDALKELTATEKAGEKTGEKIIIEPELNPLAILQLGNHVAGSCLNVNGCNAWSAIVNATEVNKRVLWAKDESGTILARLLIGVDEENRIVRFPIYYATDKKMEYIFNDYIIELAKKCGFGINGDQNKVARIFNNGWYTDSSVNIEVGFEPQKYRRAS